MGTICVQCILWNQKSDMSTFAICGMYRISVVSVVLFYPTITHYRTVTLLCINLHLLVLHLRVVPLLFNNLPSTLTLSPSYWTFFYIRMCLCESQPCMCHAYSSHMLMNEIMCDQNAQDQQWMLSLTTHNETVSQEWESENCVFIIFSPLPMSFSSYPKAPRFFTNPKYTHQMLHHQWPFILLYLFFLLFCTI